MSVYDFNINCKIEYIKNNIEHKLPFDEALTRQIIDAWSDCINTEIFNSRNIRLDDVDLTESGIKLKISYTNFHNFLISNIISTQFNSFKKYILDKSLTCGGEIIKTLEAYYNTIPEKYSDLHSLLTTGNMANALAVSVLVMDKKGNLLLVKRTNKVAVGKNQYSVTATGVTDEQDFLDADPIRHCALRELFEETGLTLDLKDLRIRAIVAGVKKKQPIAIVDALVNFDLKQVDFTQNNARDFNFEIEEVKIIGMEDIDKILTDHSFTEAAFYHLSTLPSK